MLFRPAVCKSILAHSRSCVCTTWLCRGERRCALNCCWFVQGLEQDYVPQNSHLNNDAMKFKCLRHGHLSYKARRWCERWPFARNCTGAVPAGRGGPLTTMPGTLVSWAMSGLSGTQTGEGTPSCTTERVGATNVNIDLQGSVHDSRLTGSCASE